MLTREVMGVALLGLAWVTAAMVALDALIDARAMVRRLGEWKRSLIQGTVTASELAAHEVEQRVKQLDGEDPGLVFFDRKHVSSVAGGAVTAGGEQLHVTGAVNAEVWIDAETRAAAAACSSPAAFESMTSSAKAAGGGIRTVRSSIRSGAQVWLLGSKQGNQFAARLISNFDPRTWARGRLVAISGLIALDLIWVSVGTGIALWPPVFGMISIAGALVLLGHFLGMTALAMATREKSRTPAFAFLRGSWRRSTADATALAPVAER